MPAPPRFDTNGDLLTVGGIISGALGSLSVIGGGNLTLTSINTYTGNTGITAGTLTYSGGRRQFRRRQPSGRQFIRLGCLKHQHHRSSFLCWHNRRRWRHRRGAINQSSGTLNLVPAGNYVDIGSGGYGSFNLSNGTLNTNTNTGIKVGFNGLGVFTQTGGTLNLTRYFIVGTQGSGGNGVATFTGGTTTITNNNYYFDVGDAASAVGVMSIGTQAGGNAVVTTSTNVNGFQLTDSLETSGSGILNLNSGTLSLNGGSITKQGTGTSTGVLNFNGGKLQAARTT